jgi:hypothetical protein
MADILQLIHQRNKAFIVNSYHLKECTINVDKAIRKK